MFKYMFKLCSVLMYYYTIKTFILIFLPLLTKCLVYKTFEGRKIEFITMRIKLEKS